MPQSLTTPPQQTDYVKHIIECNCVLPQFKYRGEPPLYHRFVVFSVLDQNGLVVPAYAKCQNCGIIHKVLEVGKSVIMRREELGSLLTEDELANGLSSAQLRDILKQYKVDYATWQQAKFILENQMWGRVIILSRDEMDGMIVGKYVMILGENLFKIDSYEKSSDEANLDHQPTGEM